MNHIHTCMACGEKWYCPHAPGTCKAGAMVLPSVTLPGPNGPTVFHHACKTFTAASTAVVEGEYVNALRKQVSAVIKAYDENSGAEPSVSVLDRAVDGLRLFVKP